jgi:DNA-binding CsgD family transcriptional regulator
VRDTPGTATAYLNDVRRKTGLASRAEAARWFAVPSSDAPLASVLSEGERFFYLSARLGARTLDASGGLTPAERAVAQLACQGLSNLQSAQARASSERTVANQLASLYRKLSINSRVELLCVLSAGTCRAAR